LLGDLARNPQVLALAFHVDYFDSLGWADKFALPYAGQRQRRYAQALELRSAFTPQIIIDGQLSFIGSDRRGILTALGSARDGVPVAISRQGDALAIEVGEGRAQHAANVMLVAYRQEATTAIGRGENAGHTLREFNIVRATYALGTWGGKTQRFALPWSSLPKDATAAAVLIQQAGPRSILGAATYPLR
jgi:hypothetical protein